jgi:hypothetical protein
VAAVRFVTAACDEKTEENRTATRERMAESNSAEVSHALADICIAICAVAAGLRVPGCGRHDSPVAGSRSAGVSVEPRQAATSGVVKRNLVQNLLKEINFRNTFPQACRKRLIHNLLSCRTMRPWNCAPQKTRKSAGPSWSRDTLDRRPPAIHKPGLRNACYSLCTRIRR